MKKPITDSGLSVDEVVEDAIGNNFNLDKYAEKAELGKAIVHHRRAYAEYRLIGGEESKVAKTAQEIENATGKAQGQEIARIVRDEIDDEITAKLGRAV